MPKNICRSIVLSLCLAMLLAFGSCSGSSTDGIGDLSNVTQTIEIPSNYLKIDQFDSYKETYVGGTRGGAIYYLGSQAILSYTISDPSIISFEFTEVYSYTNFGFEDSVTQNFEITGLKTGRAAVEITFAEGQGDPHAIALIDVVVFDEIWPGYPYGY